MPAQPFRATTCLSLGLAMFVAVLAGASSAAGAEHVDIPNLMFQKSVNLVLSVSDVEASKEFYGEVLKLKPTANLNLPGGLVMTRYQVGTSEIKLLHSDATKKTMTGPVDAAIRIRPLTLHFPDEQAIVERFEAVGREAPAFTSVQDGSRRTTVTDPDGIHIELVIPPEGAPEDAFDSIELRLTVSDLEKSREFYRDFIGFEESGPRKAPDPGCSDLYSYRFGNTTITIGSFGADLPVHAGRWEKAFGLRFVQYIVQDLDAVNEFAKVRGVTIEQPIFPLGRLARIMFIADPDGIINEFVGLPIPVKPAK